MRKEAHQRLHRSPNVHQPQGWEGQSASRKKLLDGNEKKLPAHKPARQRRKPTRQIANEKNKPQLQLDRRQKHRDKGRRVRGSSSCSRRVGVLVGTMEVRRRIRRRLERVVGGVVGEGGYLVGCLGGGDRGIVVVLVVLRLGGADRLGCWGVWGRCLGTISLGRRGGRRRRDSVWIVGEGGGGGKGVDV